MSQPTILVVEDEAIVAADLAGRLEQLGYAVAGIVSQGEEAIAMARQHRPDLILMDIKLGGGLDGAEAAAAIRRECDLPVVFLTAHSDAATVDRAKLAEPFGYITKPFEERELRTSIEMALYRHRADRQVRDSEERFRRVAQSATDAIVTADAEGTIVFWNHAAERIFGYPAAEIVGQALWKLAPERFRAAHDRAYTHALSQGTLRLDRYPRETVGLRKDGTEVPVELSMAIWRLGGALFCTAIVRDITDRKRAEIALQESEMFHRQTLESIPGMVFTTRPDGYCDYQSQQWVDYTGVPMSEHLGDGWNRLLHPEDQPRALAAWRAAVAGRAPYDLEYRVRRQDGVYEWFKVIGRPIRDTAGQIVRWFGVAINIEALQRAEEALRRAHDELELRVEQRTRDLKQAICRLEAEIETRARLEAQLRESEERYRTLFAAAPVGIAITDPRGRVFDANAALGQMLGLSLSELQADNARSFYAKPSDRRRLVAQVRREGRVDDFRTRLRRKDGAEFFASLRLSWIEVQRRQLFLTLVTDITQRQVAERHIQGIAALQELFLSKSTRREYLDAVVHLLRDWCGCACAGVRLLDGHGYLPFAASAGYTRWFLKEESRMNLDTNACVCLKAVMGRPTEGHVPLVRTQGCFLRTSLGDLAAQLMPDGPQRAALPCVTAGYESVVQAPIRYRGRILGAIQLADRHENRFPIEAMLFLESAAPLVGEALHRFQVEDELRESEARFRSMFNRHRAVMLLTEPESGVIVDANQAAARFYGYARRRLCSMRIEDLCVPAADAEAPAADRASSESGDSRVMSHRLSNGEIRTVEIHSTAITVGDRTLRFSITHDVTERRRLEREVLDIGDRERQRIGRDLHDSLGGALSGLALVAKALAQTLARTSAQEAVVAEEVVQGINEAIRRARSIAHGLCPVGLSAFGFVSGLQELAQTVEQRHGIACRVRAPADVVIGEDFVASHLFQIVEEAVNNAVRHSKARKIAIDLRPRGQRFRLEVRDDGIGLPHHVGRSSGMGLRTMRYRADLIGAKLEFRSPARGGTVITCLLPFRAVAVPRPAPVPSGP